MAISDMSGVTGNINKMANQLQGLYEQSQNGNLINKEDIASIEKLNKEIQDLVQNSKIAKDQLAGTVSELGRNFSSVIENMQNIRNNNPSADIARQIEDASSKFSQFIGLFQQLGQTKLEINSENLKDVVKTAEDARKAIEDMQASISKNNNTGTFDPVLNSLKSISDIFKDGNVANQINATADAMSNLNRNLGDNGQVLQNSSMSIKALGDQMTELSRLTNTMNSGLSDVFNQITNAGGMQNATPFTAMSEQIKDITNSLDTLKTQVKSQDTWNTPEALGAQTKKIEEALQNVLGQQQQAFSQALGNVSSSTLESTLKDYANFRDNLAKNITNIQDILSGPLPEIPAGASDEVVSQIKKAREKAQEYLSGVREQLSHTQFSGLEGIYNQSVNMDFQNIMGQSSGDRNDILMRMATGQSLGNNYDASLNRIGHSAANIHNKALVLAADAQDPNSQMTSLDRQVDYRKVAEQSQELARLQQEYNSVKDQFSGAYSAAMNETDPGKRDQAMEKAKERYDYLVKMQAKLKGHALDMGSQFRLANPEDKQRLGKEALELYEYIRSVLKETASSGDSLFSMGKTLKVDPEALEGLRSGTTEVKNMKAAMDDAQKSSINLWDSIKTGWNEIKGPFQLMAKGLAILGVGSLGGGPLTMLTKSLQYHNEQGRSLYESQRGGLQYGLDADYGLGNSVNRLHAGAALHQRSGGRIGIEELNKAYDSAMGNVGGRYGVSAGQGADEMNSLVNNTFMMQKMYGIDQGTMNDAYKTFYKDMGQSANEAADSIARITQTAAAANIPAAQYLKMVSGIAQQFMKIGLSGKDAESMMGNFINQGMRAEVAQSMTQQTGQAMGNFATNKNYTGYATAMMGGDPFEGMAAAAYSHEADGSERKGWSSDVAKMMDTMTNQMDLVTGGDPRLRRIVLNDHFKNMGYDQRGASTLTSAFMSGNHEVFQKALEKENKRQENPNASLEEVNNRLAGQLDKLTGNLSEQDKITADVNVNLYELAFKTGPKIDQALRQLHDTILKFADSMGKLSETIATGLANLTNSGLFKNVLKPGLDLVAEHPAETVVGSYLGYKALKAMNRGGRGGGIGPGSGNSSGISKILRALSKNPKTAMFAAGAGLLAYNSIGSAHSREGDVNERIYDKLHAIYTSMLNGDVKIGGGAPGSPGNYSGNSPSSNSPAYNLGGSGDDTFSAGTGAAMMGSLFLSSKADTSLSRIIGTAKHADDYKIFGKMALSGDSEAAKLALSSGAKLMRNAFGKSALTGIISEGAFGAYDIYNHKKNGDYQSGDIARVGSDAAVNLGYMATGAAIGSIVPGVGTLAGGIVGGLAGVAVDAFGDKDASGRGINDRIKDTLYSMFTGGDTIDDLEKRRESTGEGDKIKAKLQMLGYSDKEADEMSKNLIDNKDELEKHGIHLNKMTVEQKAYMAEHAKQLGINKASLEANSGQTKKACEEMKSLADAIRNTKFGDKVNKEQNAREAANNDKANSELDDKSVLFTQFNHKMAELQQKRSDTVDYGDAKDLDEKMHNLQRAMYLIDNGEDQRREDHGAEYDKMSIWGRGGLSRDQYIDQEINNDWKYANQFRDEIEPEYAKSRANDPDWKPQGSDGLDSAASDMSTANQAEDTISNPGGGSSGDTMSEDDKSQKADDSRRQAAKTSAESIVKQNQKQEELNKEGNKLVISLIEQEKVLFKALEVSENHNTKQLHNKLEEIRRLLDKIQFNTGKMAGGRGNVKGNAYQEVLKKDPEIAKWIDEASSKYGVDKNLIATVMKQESSFRRGLGKNSAGAEGLMQVTDDKGTGLNPSDDHDNIMIGTKYLGAMLSEFNGDKKLAFAAYNMGPNGVKELMSQYGNSWESIAPYVPAETKKYIDDNFGPGGGGNFGGVDYDKNYGPTGCTQVARDAMAGNSVVDSLPGLYVPDWMAAAKENGTWRDADYQPKPGDLVITNGDGHVVVANGDGTYTGNKTSLADQGLASATSNSPLSELGTPTGYIATGDGGYTPSSGSGYTPSNDIDTAEGRLTPITQGTGPSTVAGTNPQGIVGDAKAAMKNNTGKAFYDGTMIEHHTGGIGIWYGNQSGNTLNWGTMQAAMHDVGGEGTDIGGHRKWMEESRKARIASDAAMGVTDQNPVATRNFVPLVPINHDIAQEMAKNIEANRGKSGIDNSDLISAGNGGDTLSAGNNREISVNITIDKAVDNFVDSFGDGIKDLVAKLGAKVERLEERSVKTAQTARTALHSGINIRNQVQEDQYGGR